VFRLGVRVCVGHPAAKASGVLVRKVIAIGTKSESNCPLNGIGVSGIPIVAGLNIVRFLTRIAVIAAKQEKDRGQTHR